MTLRPLSDTTKPPPETRVLYVNKSQGAVWPVQGLGNSLWAYFKLVVLDDSLGFKYTR